MGLRKLKIFSQCKKYKISLWQCPDFLFLIMGLIIACLVLIAYGLSLQYIQDPKIASLIVLALASLLLIIAFIINRSLEKLLEVNRMKTQFISIISHQLRTPVSNIKWAIEILMSEKMKQMSENHNEYFKILKENSDRMEKLIGDLLAVSKIEAGEFYLKREEFSLSDLTLEVIKEFLPLAKEAKVKIDHFFEERIPPVFADKYQIKQVVENLLDNAIRYSRENGVVNIKIERKGKKVYFEIKDDGIGIPSEEQKYIFQKFFRAKNVMEYQTSGTGLGLYISKNLVEMSRGKIGFQSQEGKGSKFWFYLPIK